MTAIYFNEDPDRPEEFDEEPTSRGRVPPNETITYGLALLVVAILMAAGEVDSPAVRRGIDYLLGAEREGGNWREKHYNAVGFPRVFYLRYHGYRAYFPVWALALYRRSRAESGRDQAAPVTALRPPRPPR